MMQPTRGSSALPACHPFGRRGSQPYGSERLDRASFSTSAGPWLILFYSTDSIFQFMRFRASYRFSSGGIKLKSFQKSAS